MCIVYLGHLYSEICKPSRIDYRVGDSTGSADRQIASKPGSFVYRPVVSHVCNVQLFYVHYIFSVPHEKRLEAAAAMNGGPSGPMTELEIITTDQLLDMGKEHTSEVSEYPGDEEKMPMLESEEGIEDPTEQGTNVQDTDKPSVAVSQSNISDITENQNTNNSDNVKDYQKPSDSSESIPNTVNLNHTDNKATPEPTIEFGIESTSLFNEVGKLLEAKHVSFDNEQKTSI